MMSRDSSKKRPGLARALALAFVFLPCLPAFAQDAAGPAETAVSDEEDVFGEEESVTAAVENSNSVRDAFMQTAAPVLVGTFSGNVDLTGVWDNPWGGGFNLFSADSATLSPASGLSLGFSAKPEKNLGFYGEIKTAYPFVKSAAVYDSAGAAIGTATVPDISVFNLYAKFDWQDKLFFSFGKQYLKWGQGYFFTPANDILALGSVNLDNINAEREGPLSLKVNAPLPGTMATAYLYAIMNSASLSPTEIAVAPKFEIAFPSVEFSVSGYYQKDSKPRVIGSASYAGNGLSLFGEGLVAFGSEKYFVARQTRDVASMMGNKTFQYRVVEKPDTPFFTGTVGGMYSKSWEKALTLSVMGQYLYDGEGQANISLDDVFQAALERMDPRYDFPDDPAFSVADMAAALGKLGSRLGQHYAGLSVSASGILDSDFSASVFAMANLADLSGWVKPSVSWQIFDRLSASAWASFSFGEGGDEFTNLGGIYKAARGLSAGPTGVSYREADLTPTMQLGLSFSLGTGAF